MSHRICVFRDVEHINAAIASTWTVQHHLHTNSSFWCMLYYFNVQVWHVHTHTHVHARTHHMHHCHCPRRSQHTATTPYLNTHSYTMWSDQCPDNVRGTNTPVIWQTSSKRYLTQQIAI
jgi:hypothetical protein